MVLLKIVSLLLLGFSTCCNAALSSADQTLILGLHNKERAASGSSNMQYMAWSSNLTNDIAQMLALFIGSSCPAGPIPPPSPFVGSNYFQFPSTKPNYTAAVLAWISTKANYSYDMNVCFDGDLGGLSCDSYLQIVSAESTQMACDVFNCTDVDGITKRSVFFCAYIPVFDRMYRPFLRGKPCTKCSTGTYTCTGATNIGLCDKGCKSGFSCACKAECKNCGTLVTSSCSCQCPIGRTGLDCSGPNNDTLSSCGGFYTPENCRDPMYPWVPLYCPQLCGNIAPPSKCPDNFTYIDGMTLYNDTFTGSCYKVNFQPLTQAQAAANCSKIKSGHLVYFDNPSEMAAVTMLLSQTFPGPAGFGELAAWIGACRKNVSHNEANTSFVWSPTCTQGTVPGAGSKPFPWYTNWIPTEPSNTNYDSKTASSGEWCVEMKAGLPLTPIVGWNDVNCNVQRPLYICEADPVC